MILHVFNPDHDLAMASNLVHFTAPFAGRGLRADLCYIPALWSQPGDAVLVDDKAFAEQQFRQFLVSSGIERDAPHWLRWTELATTALDGVEPWGWNRALRHQLLSHGVSEAVLPTADEIDDFRRLSHRRYAAELLRRVQSDGTTGVAAECQSIDEIEEKIISGVPFVVKAPWSSSGRGVRFFDGGMLGESQKIQNLRGWIANVLRTQGSVMVEPYYNKVIDIGMEFVSDGMGRIDYLGLSLFFTDGSAYTGNLLATETEKEGIISRYISTDLLERTKAKLQEELGLLYKGHYRGPFGVDMMVVSVGATDKKTVPDNPSGDYLLHPCVEINLRRTMGHVALALSSPDVLSRRQVMRVSYDGSFHLQLTGRP